jgi:hypothetical protein
MKRAIVLIFIFKSVLFAGCDYPYMNEYVIANKTSSNIVIKTIINPYDHGIRFTDTIYIVKPEEELTFIHNFGMGGKHYIPEDFYVSEDTIPPASKFDIYIGDTVQNKLRLRKYWEFSAVKQVGTYKLRVTNSILEEF